MCSDDVEVTDLLRAALGDALRPTLAPPPGYAVVAHPPDADGPATVLPVLRLGPAAVLRSRSPKRLGHALLHHLRSHPPAAPDRVRLTTAAVRTHRAAVLLPGSQLWSPGTERLLEQAGLFPVDTRAVELDADGRLTAPGWAWGAPTPASPVPVVRWLVPSAPRSSHGFDTGSPSGRVAIGAGHIDPSSEAPPQFALELVTTLGQAIAPIDEPLTPADLVAELTAAIDGSRHVARRPQRRGTARPSPSPTTRS